MDICVFERIILSLFSDFHSLTFLTTDELRICSKRITHSITQSFAIGFYNHWKWDWSIIWLSVQIKESINQPIHEWINDAHFMQWITIIRLLLLTNWHSVTRILYIQSFFLSIICFCFYLVNAWLRDWIDAYSVCYYLSRSSKQQGK